MRKFIMLVFTVVLVSCTSPYKPKYTAKEIHKILTRYATSTGTDYKIIFLNNTLIISKSNPVYVAYTQNDLTLQSQVWYQKSEAYITSDYLKCKYSNDFKLLESKEDCGQLALEEAQDISKSFTEDLKSLGLNQKDIEFYVNNFEY